MAFCENKFDTPVLLTGVGRQDQFPDHVCYTAQLKNKYRTSCKDPNQLLTRQISEKPFRKSIGVSPILWSKMRSCLYAFTDNTNVNGSLTWSILVLLSPGAALTCFKHGGDVGGALTVTRDHCHADLVLLTTFVYGNLAASGGWSTIQGGARAVHSCGPVRGGPKHQVPRSGCHAFGATVGRRNFCHSINCWGNSLKAEIGCSTWNKSLITRLNDNLSIYAWVNKWLVKENLWLILHKLFWIHFCGYFSFLEQLKGWK